MKKVSLFFFDGFYYVIPYMAEVSTLTELIDKANGYLSKCDIEAERQQQEDSLNAYNIGKRRPITFEETKQSLFELWILSHDKSHLIATNDKSFEGLPTILEAIMEEYSNDWDGSFMFPYAGEVVNGVLQLEVREDSCS